MQESESGYEPQSELRIAEGGFDPRPYMRDLGGNAYLEVKWRLLWLRTDYPNADVTTQLVSDERYDEPAKSGNGMVFTKEAVFKAHIAIPGHGSATGYGSETQADFKDYREKAETKALGRALAALGFGTQFSPDFDYGSMQHGRPVDSPVYSGARGAGAQQGGGPRPVQSANNAQITGQVPQDRVYHPNAGNVASRPQGSTQGANAGGGPRPVQQGGGQGGNYGQVVQQQGGQRPQQGGGQIQNPDAPASQKQVQFVMDLLGNMGYDPNAFDWSGLTKGEASHYIEVLRSGQLPEDVRAALAEVGQMVQG